MAYNASVFPFGSVTMITESSTNTCA